MYFLSNISMDGNTLNPRIPDNYFTKHGYEDNKTPRVCFAPSIGKALIGLGRPVDDEEFYVHIPANRVDQKYIHKPTQKEVPDVKQTGEMWVLKPVKLKCIGKVKVVGL